MGRGERKGERDRSYVLLYFGSKCRQLNDFLGIRDRRAAFRQELEILKPRNGSDNFWNPETHSAAFRSTLTMHGS